MKIKQLTIGILSVVLTGCGNTAQIKDADLFDWVAFGTPQLIQGELVTIDSLLRPTRLLVCDSTLITVDKYSDNFVQVYNKHTGAKICENVPRGMGPNELLYCWSLQVCNDKVWAFDMQMASVQVYDKEKFLSTSGVSPLKQIKLTDYTPTNVLSTHNDNLVTTSLVDKTNLMTLHDAEGRKQERNTVAFPQIGADSPSDIQNRLFERRLCYDEATNRIVVFYQYTDLIEIYDSEMNLQSRIQGPDNILPSLQEKTTDGVKTVSIVPSETKFTYLCGATTGKKIYMLYCGELPESGKYLQDKILVFDYKGNPVERFTLQYPCYAFCVDEAEGVLYALSELPDAVVVKYKLPAS